jgi:hypothetical protein
MPWIAVLRKDGATGTNSWKVLRLGPSRLGPQLPLEQSLKLPPGINGTATTGRGHVYGGRLYMSNVATSNIMLDEHYRVLKQGMVAPQFVPTLSATAGPGPSGDAVVYVAWYDELTDEWSPLSAPSASVPIANQSRTTSGIVATPNEERATHLGIFVSMNGALPRLAVKRSVGCTSVVENVATLALGEAAPDDYIPMPRGTMNAIYHERQLIAGDSLNPDVVYASASGYPERYEGLAFATRKGERVRALLAVRDVTLVLTDNTPYILRGYTDDDMVMEPVEAEIGCFGQDATAVVWGNAIWADPKGVWLYNGSFTCISRDIKTLWVEQANNLGAYFSKMVTAYDPNKNTVSFLVDYSGLTIPTWIPNPDGKTIRTVGFTMDTSDIVPQLAGDVGQPDWMVDVYSYAFSAVGLLANPGEQLRTTFFGVGDGSTYPGYIGYFNIFSTQDFTTYEDDFGNALWIRTKAYDMGDPGGDESEGKHLTRLWTYIESEQADWKVYMMGGDEHAWKMLRPNNSDTYYYEAIAASYLADTPAPGESGYVYTAQSVHPHIPSRVSGRSFTFEYNVPSPVVGVVWRGLGGIWGPGRATRHAASVVGGGE